MDRKSLVSTRSKVLMAIGVAFVIFGLAQPGITSKKASVSGELRAVSMKTLEKKERALEGVGRLQDILRDRSPRIFR